MSTRPPQPTGPKGPQPSRPKPPPRPPQADPSSLLAPEDLAAAKQIAAEAPPLPQHARDVLHALYGPQIRKSRPAVPARAAA